MIVWCMGYLFYIGLTDCGETVGKKYSGFWSYVKFFFAMVGEFLIWPLFLGAYIRFFLEDREKK